MELQQLVPLLLGSIVLIVGAVNPSLRRARPATKMICASFLAWWIGAMATVLEEFVAARFFDIAEHGAYAVAAFLLATACWRIGRPETRPSP